MTPISALSPHELASINAGRIERGLAPIPSQLRGVQASASFLPRTTLSQSPTPALPSSPPLQSSAFNAGDALERQRVVFALNLRKAIARHLQNRSEGSGDESAVAQLKQEKKEITVEPAPSPRESRALTEGEQAFAAALCAKINRTLRPEARRR